MASRRIRRTKSLAGYTAAVYQDLIDLKSRNNPRSIAASAIDGGSLAGEIELINKSLQSANYMPGVDGWKIDGSGNAEFGNVYVRGDINAYSGTIGYWNISNPSVERTFGDTTLFGTFLESFDHGFTDDGATIGTYVSLFKSYIDVPTVITKISVTSDVVTITALDHNFIVGDKIVIEFDDAAYSAYESNTYLTVTERTLDTFSYVKRVADSGESGNTVVEVDASGLAQIYNEDVAGLYLRDYSKANFDYGFFSNKGIAYTSAEVLNLVHNPSFEYKVGPTNTYSNAGWSATSGITQLTFASGHPYASYASEFGASITWTSSARTDYLTATVDYNAGDDYKIFDSSTPLYLGLDIFSAPVLANVAVSAVSTSNATHVLVQTSTAHGMAIGDYVYLNFTAMGVTNEYADYAYNYNYQTYGTRVFEVIGTSGANIFYVENTLGTTETVTLSASPKVYPKVVSPAFKLSEIKFKFGSDETTTLENVLDAVYKTTDWASAATKEVSVSATTTVESVINSVLTPPMRNGKNVAYVLIDPQKIEEYYLSLDPAGHANANPFYILFPTWTYKKDLDGSTTATKLLNTSYAIDNVYLSKSSKFFYADSSTASNSWYTLGSGGSAPTQASIEAPRNWIDIDLDSQTAIFDYIDYIGLESSTYSRPLSIKPSISMAPSAEYFSYIDYLNSYSSANSYIPTVDSNTLSLTAGKSTYLSTSITLERDSYINIAVDRGRSGVEMVANWRALGFNAKTASVSASVDNRARGLVTIQADYIVANTAKFVTDVGKPSLNASYITNNTNDTTLAGTNHTVYELETTTITGITDTTFASGSTDCVAYFTTGPSGVVEIHVYADYQNTTVASGTGLSYVSFQIADVETLTTQIDSSVNRSVVRSGTLRESGTVFYIYAGSPNTRYRIRTMHRTTTGTTFSVFRRSIMVIPIT